MSDTTGGCLCGQVRYRIVGEPLVSLLCHCQMCQRASGSAFAPLMFVRADEIKVTSGELKSYKSSIQAEREFCVQCGSTLFFNRFSRSDIRGVMVGSLDNPHVFKPAMQVCMSSSVAWLDTSDLAEGHAEKPPTMTPTLIYNPVSGVASERS